MVGLVGLDGELVLGASRSRRMDVSGDDWLIADMRCLLGGEALGAQGCA